WYCGSCQQYQDVHPQDTPRPPPPPPSGGGTSSKAPMIIAGIVVIIIIIAAALFFLVMGPEDDDDKGKTVKMNMADLENDLVIDDTGVNFKSLEPGDTLVIEDEITYIASDDYWGETVTYIWFESAHEGESENDWREVSYGEVYYEDYDLTFQGDLTDDYQEGDLVKVTLHVVDLTDIEHSGDYKPDGYSGSGYKIEAFAENWEFGGFQHLPESTITNLSSPPDDDDTVAQFPTIDVSLRDSPDGDWLYIKHIQGEPLDWSDYKMIIINNSDPSNIATLTSLSGSFSAGDVWTFDSNTPGFGSIDFKVGNSYDIEIYNLKENKREYHKANLICIAV
ncbi:MAG: hypothetical protein JSV49_01210, partial [Thermoplasmata archaeon]